MQAFYSGYVNTGKMKPLKGGRVNYASQGYFERSEGRGGYEGAAKSNKKKNKKKSAGDIAFMILTILFLFILFPVGIVMLWTKKFKMGVGGKLLFTILGVIFFLMMLAFAANIKTENPKIKSAQDKVNGAFDWVYGKTGAGIDAVLDWSKEQLGAFGGKLNEIWDAIDEDVARKTLDILGETADNVSFYKEELPGMMLDKYVEVRGYTEPEQPELPEKQAEEGIVLIVTPTPEATEEPAETPEPTPAPTQTPEPTREPIELPPIKDVAGAEVFFTSGGTYYHAVKNCSGMLNAVSHTLREAKNEGKKYCAKCNPLNFDIMENRDLRYMWVDDQNVAHTTDVCLEFATGGYKIVLFDEVYKGHYSYCPSCKGEQVYEYMARNDRSFNVNIEDADAQTQLLYRAEEAITVYYGTNSRYYHANTECQQMTDSRYVHNLFEALHRDGMKPCQSCNPDNEGDVQERLNKKK